MTDEKPGLVLAGGCILAMLAASINAAFILGLGVSVSHLTGDVSRFASETVRLGQESNIAVLYLVTAVIGFVSGAGISGYFIHQKKLEFTNPYGRAITFIGFLILLSAILYSQSLVLSILLASTACGLQNGLATHYRGMILRTTHITGLLTDFGIAIGMRLKGDDIPVWKILVPFTVTLSFFLGGLLGAMLTIHFHHGSLAIISVFYIVGGIAWSLFRDRLVRLKKAI